MAYEIPAYAADRYKLVVDQVSPKCVEVGVYTTDGTCTLLAGEACLKASIRPVVVRLVREADAKRLLDNEHDAIGIAAQIGRLAAELATLRKEGSPVAEGFNGDYATVFEHLKRALGDLVDVVATGSETAGDMGNDLESAAWKEAEEAADYAVTYLEHAQTTLDTAARHALKGQTEQRAARVE